MKFNLKFSLVAIAAVAFYLVKSEKIRVVYAPGFSIQDRNFLDQNGILLDG